VTAYSYSQETTSISPPEELKVTYDELTMELTLNPFNGSLNLNNMLDQIKVRYFISNAFAIRAGITVKSTKKDLTTTNPYGTSPYDIEENKKSFLFGANLGIEQHFLGTRRLSPYVGIELTGVSKTSSHVINDGVTETTIENAWRTTAVVNNSFVYGYEEKAYFSYGANVLAGFDFYVAKRFFIGYEVAFTVYNKEFRGVDITVVGTPFPIDNPDINETEFSLGPSLLNGIRIGYVF
jgi:hypothetical protein